MSFNVSKLLQGSVNFLKETRDGVVDLGRLAITFDRTNMVFGDTHEEQIKGRDQTIIKCIAVAVVCGLILSFCIYEYSVFSTFSRNIAITNLVVPTVLALAFSLKEIVLQSIARANDIKKNQIEQNTTP